MKAILDEEYKINIEKLYQMLVIYLDMKKILKQEIKKIFIKLLLQPKNLQKLKQEH